MSLYEGDSLENNRSMKPFELEGLKFAEESLAQFESRLILFFSGDVDKVTLFKADFARVPDNGSVGFNEPMLQFIAPNRRGKVRMGVLTSEFYLMIKDYLKSPMDSPLLKHSEILPSPLTDGLKDFIKRNPTLKIRVASATYDVGESTDETALVIAHRYFHPVTNHPIADIWQAERNPDLDTLKAIDESERKPLRFSLGGFVRHPVFSSRR